MNRLLWVLCAAAALAVAGSAQTPSSAGAPWVTSWATAQQIVATPPDIPVSTLR